jgi:hypothetical protein
MQKNVGTRLNNKCYVHRILCDTITVLLPTLTKLAVLYFSLFMLQYLKNLLLKKVPKLHFQNVAALHHIKILLINKLDFRRELYEQKKMASYRSFSDKRDWFLSWSKSKRKDAHSKC